jgi:hypothetical protein
VLEDYVDALGGQLEINVVRGTLDDPLISARQPARSGRGRRRPRRTAHAVTPEVLHHTARHPALPAGDGLPTVQARQITVADDSSAYEPRVARLASPGWRRRGLAQVARSWIGGG